MPKAGELLIIEQGEFSDQSWHGPFRVLKDFSLNDTCEEWCGHRPPINLHDIDWEPLLDPDLGFRVDHYNFLAWLSQNGYIEDLDARVIHLGCYDKIEHLPEGDEDE